MDENKPLLGNGDNGGSEGDSNSDSRSQRCWACRFQLLALVLLVIAAAFLFPARSNTDEPVIVLPNSVAPNDETSKTRGKSLESITPVKYRPFCLTHDNRVTARILQTSMGNPSQQWSHLPCYSQPDKVGSWMGGSSPPDPHINGYGAPDAVLWTNLSDSPFADRSPILGFGAAFTDAASVNYQRLSDKGKTKLMELLYGRAGLGYSLGRTHINSCDFSVESYAFDNVDGDFDLNYFDMNVTHDAQKDGMIDMMLRATSVFNEEWKSKDGLDGNFKMLASPWSPPAWMKRPAKEDKPGLEHAPNMTGSAEFTCLREGTKKMSRYAGTWALYFSKFLEACTYILCDCE